MRKRSMTNRPTANLQVLEHKNVVKSLSLIALMLLSTIASINFFAIDASANTTDQDGDGLTYGLEYLINSFPNDPDTDNDGLPDGWEWKYGLDPLSSANDDGAVGDPDGDGMSNLPEYTYQCPLDGIIQELLTYLITEFGGMELFQSVTGTKRIQFSI